MSKQLKNIIIAFAVVIVLTGVFLLLKFLPSGKGSANSSSSSSTTEIKLLEKKTENIKTVSVANATDTYVLTSSGNTNTIDKLKGYPVNETSISSLVSSAAAISAEKKVEDNASNLDQYGFSKPTATVVITFTDNSQYKFDIGNKSSGGTGYYFKEQGNNTVYIVSSTSLSSFTEPLKSFINTTLSDTIESDKLTDIDNIVIGGSARTEFTFKKYTEEELKSLSGYETYKITKPVQMTANTDVLSKVVQSFSAISAAGVESLDTSAASLKKYGLDKPKYTISFDYNKKTTKILLGNKDSSGNYYAMIPNGKVIYTLASSTFTFLDYKLTDLASAVQFIVNIDKVKTITVSWSDKQYKFDLSGEGDKLVVKSGDKTITTDNFRTLYQLFIGSSIRGEAQKPKTAAALTIKFDYKDTKVKSDVISFLPVESQQYFLDINGKGYFYVLKNYIDKVMTSCEKVYNGETITADY